MASKKPTGTPNAAKNPAEQAPATKHSVARNKQTVMRIVEGVDEIAKKIYPELKEAFHADDQHTILNVAIGKERVRFFIDNSALFNDDITLLGCVDLVEADDPGFGDGTKERDAKFAESKLAGIEASIRAARTLMRGGFKIYTRSWEGGPAEFNFILPLMEYKKGREISDQEIARAAMKIAETVASIGAPITYGEDDSEG